ncbi:hypothetical protein DERF_003274 [Dermatophagoides farinae]|uniref:Uncharacterized protein n=1 Tax=Dermatophagoides farinae TaxID=6954 RepID=A0A922ICA1_DERFA|nr:hypothetical protein DERF_003274 [Dermatophagoides farinae]
MNNYDRVLSVIRNLSESRKINNYGKRCNIIKEPQLKKEANIRTPSTFDHPTDLSTAITWHVVHACMQEDYQSIRSSIRRIKTTTKSMNNKTFVWLMTLEWTTIEHLKTEKKKQEQINWKKNCNMAHSNVVPDSKSFRMAQ